MADTGVERVTVVRGKKTLLRDVTLLADDGELLVVLGPSGSGKSTLLRVLAGLDDVTTGEVLIRGRRVTGVPSGRRRAAMVFQADALIPFLDVSRNLGWGLRVQKRPEAEVQERVSGRARQLRLGRLLPRRPRELSGGERGLVGLGHALVQTPDVFLFDEPLGDLDAVHRTEVRRQMVEVVRSLGVPTFYVTHDQAEGLAVADRVAVLDEGAVVQVGRPMELYDRPANLLVAGFVGTPPMGLLSARLVSAGGQAGFELGARILPLWRAVPPPLLDHVDRELVLGLRAEDVHPAEADPSANAVTLDAVVSDVQYTGWQNTVTVLVSEPPVVAPGSVPAAMSSSRATLHACFPGHAAVHLGDAVQIAVDATRAHVFDALSGEALWHGGEDSGGQPAS